MKSQDYAVTEDVDLATFIRFVEWMYNGCYTAPTPKDESSPSHMTPAEDNSDQCGFSGSPIGLGSKKEEKHIEKTGSESLIWPACRQILLLFRRTGLFYIKAHLP